MTELFTEEDVRRYARVLATYDWNHSLSANGEVSPGQRGEVEAILSALAEDGRLLRTRGDRRVHWGVRDREGVKPVGAGSGSEVLARIAADSGDGVLVWQTRTVWPNGEIHWGPWESAESGGALPSDTPALADAYAAVRADELELHIAALEKYVADHEANGWNRMSPAYETDLILGRLRRRVAALRAIGPDPVSVLEEETPGDQMG